LSDENVAGTLLKELQAKGYRSAYKIYSP